MDEAKSTVFTIDSVLYNRNQTDIFLLRDKQVVLFERSEIDKFKLDYGDSLIVCEKDTAGGWMVTHPVQKKGKSWKVSGVVMDIDNLRAKKFLEYNERKKASYGLDKPLVAITLYRNGEDIVVGEIGKEIDDENRYFYNVKTGRLYLVRADCINDYTFSVEDLLEEEESEEQTST